MTESTQDEIARLRREAAADRAHADALQAELNERIASGDIERVAAITLETLYKLWNLHGEVETAASAYADQAGELAAALRAYMEERSESWQESERGQAYEVLAGELESIEELGSPLEDVPGLDV